MTSPLRFFAAAALSLALVVSAAGCSLIPNLTPATGDPLVDTSWSGTDSDGDEWGFLFESDGTVGLTFNGETYDDATDTWAVDKGAITIEIAFSSGVATLTGPYSDGASSIDLEGSQGDLAWTVTITED